MVPLPARLCFECGRSCRKAPLLACDYCPLYFHQDCLDPPLTAFPSGRWMCPNHVNHFLDQHLLNSCSATERVKLWDRFANRQIDQHAVKLQFLRKAHTANPMFRKKVEFTDRLRVKVPCSIKFYYAHPPELGFIHSYRYGDALYPIMKSSETSDENVQNSKVKDTVEPSPADREKTVSNSVISVKKDDDSICVIRENVDTALKGTEIDITENQENVGSITCEETSFSDKDSFSGSILSCRAAKEGVQLLEWPVVEALALQRLEQILNPTNESYNSVNRQLRVRAVLFPLTHVPGPPVFMSYKTFIVGTGPNCDLSLSRYGNCSFTSSKHAIIFFDQVRRVFSNVHFLRDMRIEIFRPRTHVTVDTFF